MFRPYQQEEASRKTHDPLEGLCLFAGLGTPQSCTRLVGGCYTSSSGWPPRGGGGQVQCRVQESLGDPTPQFQPWILPSAKHGGSGCHICSLCPVLLQSFGDQNHKLPVSVQTLYHYTALALVKRQLVPLHTWDKWSNVTGTPLSHRSPFQFRVTQDKYDNFLHVNDLYFCKLNSTPISQKHLHVFATNLLIYLFIYLINVFLSYFL